MARWWPRSLAGAGVRTASARRRAGRAGGKRSRTAGRAQGRRRSGAPAGLFVATALADSTSTAAAIESGCATAILEPVTDAARKNSDIAFITIMAPDGTRFTHADPAQIGRRSLGTIERPCGARVLPRSIPALWVHRYVRLSRCVIRPGRSSGWYRPGSLWRRWPLTGVRNGR